LKAVDDISLEVQEGEVFTLLGPSGCGKTTTLRVVAGLEEPDEGEIEYQGRTVVSIRRRLYTPPHKRNMGMVFQSYAIWPNMTVFENVAYPLSLRHVPAKVAREKTLRVLELVGLAGLEDRPAPMLSGGQQQRVAIARALVYEPALLLLDEPFSNLDARLREQMRLEIKLLQKRLGITVLFVTHDQIEALSLSSRIAVLDRGRVQQVASPDEIYLHPATSFVRDFLGKTVLLRGTTGDAKDGDALEIHLSGPESLFCSRFSPDLAPGQAVHVAVRPEDIVLSSACDHDRRNTLQGTVEALLFVGDRCEVQVELGGEERVLCYASGRKKLKEGQQVYLNVPEELVTVWRT